VAEDAGLLHPRVRTVVQLSDGGEWIENRWASLGLPPDVQVVDILDFRHLQQHIWTAAKACWGEGSRRTKTWAKQQTDTVLEQGPQPLLDELARIRPRRAEGREEMRKLSEYVSRNAHRLHYPESVGRHVLAAWRQGSVCASAGVRTAAAGADGAPVCGAARAHHPPRGCGAVPPVAKPGYRLLSRLARAGVLVRHGTKKGVWYNLPVQ